MHVAHRLSYSTPLSQVGNLGFLSLVMRAYASNYELKINGTWFSIFAGATGGTTAGTDKIGPFSTLAISTAGAALGITGACTTSGWALFPLPLLALVFAAPCLGAWPPRPPRRPPRGIRGILESN